jgi:hypothetical protein
VGEGGTSNGHRFASSGAPGSARPSAGLATPYQLAGGCHQTYTGQSAFVQATVFDPATHRLAVYDPLVVDAGARPAAPPVVPAVTAGSVVGIWFGFNGDNLVLVDQNGSLDAGRCVNGLRGSVFGQFAYCNAVAFFAAVNPAIDSGAVIVPPLGTGHDGLACPTSRDWGVVDQDQSDNLTGSFLALADGRTAQNTAANRAALAGAGARVGAAYAVGLQGPPIGAGAGTTRPTVDNVGGEGKAAGRPRRGEQADGFEIRFNPSDEGLVANILDPLLGCTPWMAPDLADGGTPVSSLALNELQAAAFAAPPVALVPPNNPMTKVGEHESVEKTDLYRAGVDMGPLGPEETSTAYCRNLFTRQPPRLEKDRALLQARPSPDPEVARDLLGFLGQRLAASFGGLGCAHLGFRNPVRLQRDGEVAVKVAFVREDGAGGDRVTTTSPARRGASSTVPIQAMENERPAPPQPDRAVRTTTPVGAVGGNAPVTVPAPTTPTPTATAKATAPVPTTRPRTATTVAAMPDTGDRAPAPAPAAVPVMATPRFTG